MALRIFVFLVLLIVLAACPWWLSALGLAVALIMFSPYWEGLALGFLFDSVYSYPGLAPTPFVATVIILLVISAIQLVRQKLIFYS